MSKPLVQQHRLSRYGREFHFVCYGHGATRGTQASAEPQMWFLMNGGRRLEVLPWVPDQSAGELEAALADWLDGHARLMVH
jgi:hypothetical protein